MPLFLPAESDIDGMDVPETLALAAGLLLTVAGLDIGTIKKLIVTARRCLDDDQEDQDQVAIEEALALYQNLGLPEDGVDPAAEDALLYIAPIVDFYGDNLPD